MDLIWIIEAEYIKDFKIQLKFNNEKLGVADLQGKLKGPVFAPLKDKEYFKNFTLNSWTIEWPNGADIAPEFLYHEAMKNEIELKHQ